ncbi:MAG: thiamine-phosphate kinase [Parvularculaceae bacterium]
MTGEFDIIARYFAPLSKPDDGSFGLRDDAALLTNGDLVVTKDVLVEDVHFRKKDAKSLVARKALRVNLSDLAAKGARPIGYFLGCVWPSNVKEADIEAFAEGLRTDQDAYKISLLGGDTTRHQAKGAPLIISVTMIGQPGSAGLIRRSGASAGDDVYVTGSIGDAGLGLSLLEGEFKTDAAAKKYLTGRYQLPAPRLSFGGALNGLASAAIDISDGLLADADHIAAASGVRLDVEAARIPLSAAAKNWAEADGAMDEAIAELCAFGDDYEILFTAPAVRRRSIEMASQVTKTPVARIGSVARGEGVRLIDENGGEIDFDDAGFDHFAK